MRGFCSVPVAKLLPVTPAAALTPTQPARKWLADRHVVAPGCAYMRACVCARKGSMCMCRRGIRTRGCSQAP